MKSRLSLVLVAMLVSVAARAEAPASKLVPFASDESMQRLARSQFKVDFFTLCNNFESQQNGGMCGPTSAVIVLNALRANDTRVEKPLDQSLFPAEYRAGLPKGMEPLFHRYTQGTFIDAKFESVKSRDAFFGKPAAPGEKPDGGLQLRQLHKILEAYGTRPTIRVVDEKSSIDVIRKELRENLAHPGDYVIINYYRPTLGQTGGGHISPLGAYDEKSDSFLILDVNPNGKTWVWVQTSDLVAAMNTRDRVENRGYLLVRDGE